MTGRPRSWLTWPNLVTLLRLLLVPPLCWDLITGASAATVVLLAVWAGTDWVDGALARRLGHVSRVGEVLDPVADRIGIAAIICVMAVAGLLPWELLGVVAAVDLTVAVAAGRSALARGVRVSRVGKARTTALFGGLIGLAAAAALGPAGAALEVVSTVLLGTGTLLHVVAACGYLRQAQRSRRARTSGND